MQNVIKVTFFLKMYKNYLAAGGSFPRPNCALPPAAEGFATKPLFVIHISYTSLLKTRYTNKTVLDKFGFKASPLHFRLSKSPRPHLWCPLLLAKSWRCTWAKVVHQCRIIVTYNLWFERAFWLKIFLLNFLSKILTNLKTSLSCIFTKFELSTIICFQDISA